MAVTARLLAQGEGWSVADVLCTFGPTDRPFEEQHRSFSVAVVSRGAFRYRSRAGSAMLAPGGLLLGNRGACFECGHDHGSGDRCLAFHFTAESFEQTVAGVGGARRLDFPRAALPPLPELMPLLAEAEAARDLGDPQELEELGLRLAGAAVATAAEARADVRAPSPRDRKRIATALRRIELEAHEPIALGRLAGEAATSPYHFLRTFRAVVGMTPYQFLLRTRLHHAAVRLRTGEEPVSAIAFDCGFNDLSTFNRRFRRVMGSSPGDYRARFRRERRVRQATAPAALSQRG